MKIGTVRWFNPQKGFGFIHPDDGSHNIVVRSSALANAGLSELKEGQRVSFEIQRDERTGDTSAVSLGDMSSASLKQPALATPLPATAPCANRRFVATNPLHAISAFILSAMSPLLLP